MKIIRKMQININKDHITIQHLIKKYINLFYKLLIIFHFNSLKLNYHCSDSIHSAKNK